MSSSPPPSGALLTFTIAEVEVSNLPKKTLFGKSNPFIKILWNGELYHQTQSQASVYEKKWEVRDVEPFTATISAESYEGDMSRLEMTLELYHAHALRQPELLGSVTIDGFSLASGPQRQNRKLTQLTGPDGNHTEISIKIACVCTRNVSMSIGEVSAALESAAMFDVAASASSSSSSSSSYSDPSEIPQLVDRHVIGYALSTAFVKDSRREVKPISGVSYDLMQPAFLKLPLTTVNVDMAELLRCRFEFELLAVSATCPPNGSIFRSVAHATLSLADAACAHDNRKLMWEAPLFSNADSPGRSEEVQMGTLRGFVQYFNLPLPCQLLGGYMTEDAIRESSPLLEGQPLPTITSELSLLSSRTSAGHQASPAKLAAAAAVPLVHVDALRKAVQKLNVTEQYWEEADAIERMIRHVNAVREAIHGSAALRNLFRLIGGYSALDALLEPMIRSISPWLALLAESVRNASLNAQYFESSNLCERLVGLLFPRIGEPHAPALPRDDLCCLFALLSDAAAAHSAAQAKQAELSIVFTATLFASQSPDEAVAVAALGLLRALSHGKGGAAIHLLEAGHTAVRGPVMEQLQRCDSLRVCFELMGDQARSGAVREAARDTFLAICTSEVSCLQLGLQIALATESPDESHASIAIALANDCVAFFKQQRNEIGAEAVGHRLMNVPWVEGVLVRSFTSSVVSRSLVSSLLQMPSLAEDRVRRLIDDVIQACAASPNDREPLIMLLLSNAPRTLVAMASQLNLLLDEIGSGSDLAPAIDRKLVSVCHAINALPGTRRNAEDIAALLFALADYVQRHHTSSYSGATAVVPRAVAHVLYALTSAALLHCRPEPRLSAMPLESSAPAAISSSPNLRTVLPGTSLPASSASASPYATMSPALHSPAVRSTSPPARLYATMGEAEVRRLAEQAKPAASADEFVLFPSPDASAPTKKANKPAPWETVTFSSPTSSSSSSSTSSSAAASALPASSAPSHAPSPLSSSAAPSSMAGGGSHSEAVAREEDEFEAQGGVRTFLPELALQRSARVLCALSLGEAAATAAAAAALLDRLMAVCWRTCACAALESYQSAWPNGAGAAFTAALLERMQAVVNASGNDAIPPPFLASFASALLGPESQPMVLQPPASLAFTELLCSMAKKCPDATPLTSALLARAEGVVSDPSQKSFATDCLIALGSADGVGIGAYATSKLTDVVLSRLLRSSSEGRLPVAVSQDEALLRSLVSSPESREAMAASLATAIDRCVANGSAPELEALLDAAFALRVESDADSMAVADHSVGHALKLLASTAPAVNEAQLQTVQRFVSRLLLEGGCKEELCAVLSNLIAQEAAPVAVVAVDALYGAVCDVRGKKRAEVVAAVQVFVLAHAMASSLMGGGEHDDHILNRLVQICIMAFQDKVAIAHLLHPVYQWRPYSAMLFSGDLDVQFAALLLLQRSVESNHDLARVICTSELSSHIVNVFRVAIAAAERSDGASSATASATEAEPAKALLRPQASADVIRSLQERNRQAVLALIASLGVSDKSLLSSLTIEPLVSLLRSKRSFSCISVIKGEHAVDLALGASSDMLLHAGDEIVTSVCAALKAMLNDPARRESLGPSGVFMHLTLVLKDHVIPAVVYAAEHRSLLSAQQEEALRVLLRLGGECLQLLTLAAHYADLRTFLVGDGAIPVMLSIISTTRSAALVYHAIFFVLSICDDDIARDEMLDTPEVDALGRWMQKEVDEQVSTAAASAFSKLGGFAKAEPCSIGTTGNQHAPQQYYRCHTCGLTDGLGCCVPCSKICHRGHELEGPVFGNFYCDCGSTPHCFTRKPPSLLNNGPIKLCSYIFTQNSARTQSWFSCRTCFRDGNEAVCCTCIGSCHVGHQVIFRGPGRFFCDCHRRYNGVHLCKCLKQTPPVIGEAPRYRGELFLEHQKQQQALKPADAGLQKVYAQEAPDEDEGDGGDDDTCIVCMDQKKEALIAPCGHICTCVECGSMMKQRGQPCPICREPIAAIIRAYRV